MILSLKKNLLIRYVKKQLRSFFPDKISSRKIEKNVDEVIDRLSYCFLRIQDKYFLKDSQRYFNHLNSSHYAMFLYFLSNSIYRNNADIELCEKIFYLNKIMNGIDVFYSVELPDIFLFSHPLGTVLGRAKYSDYFLVLQNCTIGGNRNLEYPSIGKNVSVYRGASIIGKCTIGDNCKISANSLVLDMDLDPNTIYIGTPSQHSIKESISTEKIWNLEVDTSD
jgi:serine O-acetyltransferase